MATVTASDMFYGIFEVTSKILEARLFRTLGKLFTVLAHCCIGPSYVGEVDINCERETAFCGFFFTMVYWQMTKFSVFFPFC